MTPGKRKDQINFSSRMAFIGFIGVTLCYIWAMCFLPEPPPPTEGIPHNYYHPKVWGHDTIVKDTMLDINWDCGEDDSIPSYDRFIDVPALEPGADSIIRVDDILYRISDDGNQWIPTHPDEHVMWSLNKIKNKNN